MLVGGVAGFCVGCLVTTRIAVKAIRAKADAKGGTIPPA
jgi:hypothetical protein